MSEKPDTVPGLGFKDKEKALETIKNVEGRDPEYQKLAIKGLIGRAKRTLTITKDKEKLQNINEAMQIFDDWLKNYEKNNLSKENRSYLPLSTIEALKPLQNKYKINNSKAGSFFKAYAKVNGEYKNLRTVASGDNEPSWDIVRNAELKKILETIESKDIELWEEDLVPSKEHLELILWAYSPEASKIKKNLDKIKEKLGDLSDQSGSKRKSSDSSESSSEEEESPAKKQKTHRK